VDILAGDDIILKSVVCECDGTAESNEGSKASHA
jgi:hypothetical protein